MQIFVSYTWSKNRMAPENRESGAVNKFTEELQKALEPSFPGVNVFQDIKHLPKQAKGDLLEPALETALKESDVLLVLISSAWLKSKWCNWEFDKFKYIRQGKSPRIVPVFWLEPDVLATSTEPIAHEVAAIRASLDDTRSDDPISVRKIAELAEQVVTSIPPSDRKASEGRDLRKGSPKKPNKFYWVRTWQKKLHRKSPLA